MSHFGVSSIFVFKVSGNHVFCISRFWCVVSLIVMMIVWPTWHILSHCEPGRLNHLAWSSARFGPVLPGMLQTSTLQGCVSRSNDQSNILFFFPTRFLQATCLGPSYSNPQERWTCVFLTYLMGFCLTRAFFWVQQIQQMSLQERSGLESLHLRKSQKLRPGSHASSASPAASVARTTATHRIPLFFSFTRGKWPSFWAWKAVLEWFWIIQKREQMSQCFEMEVDSTSSGF